MPIQAQVEYLAHRVERPIYYASSAGGNARHEIDQPMNLASVDVDDARVGLDEKAGAEHGMHPCGFDLLELPTRVRNFLDQEQIASLYEAEIESFLQAVTGCYRVHIFDHTVRASDPELRELKQVREPASLVHNDYTASSGFVCLRENLGDDAELLSQGRFQILNIWRPLVDPVEDYPLALCDARSVNPLDLIDSERRAPNHRGEIQLAVHAPEQRWYYFPEMRPCGIAHGVVSLSSVNELNGHHSLTSLTGSILMPNLVNIRSLSLVFSVLKRQSVDSRTREFECWVQNREKKR